MFSPLITLYKFSLSACADCTNQIVRFVCRLRTTAHSKVRRECLDIFINLYVCLGVWIASIEENSVISIFQRTRKAAKNITLHTGLIRTINNNLFAFLFCYAKSSFFCHLFIHVVFQYNIQRIRGCCEWENILVYVGRRKCKNCIIEWRKVEKSPWNNHIVGNEHIPHSDNKINEKEMSNCGHKSVRFRFRWRWLFSEFAVHMYRSTQIKIAQYEEYLSLFLRLCACEHHCSRALLNILNGKGCKCVKIGQICETLNIIQRRKSTNFY